MTECLVAGECEKVWGNKWGLLLLEAGRRVEDEDASWLLGIGRCGRWRIKSTVGRHHAAFVPHSSQTLAIPRFAEATRPNLSILRLISVPALPCPLPLQPWLARHVAVHFSV